MIDVATLTTSALTSLLVAGGGSAAISFGIVKAYGEKWLEARFSERLEELKHQQSRQMEELKFRVAGLLDRSQKLNQREFDVLPTIWKAIDAAYMQLAYTLSAVRVGPALGSMNQAMLLEFLSKIDMSDTHKAEIREADPQERLNIYNDVIRAKDANSCMEYSRIALEELRRGGLFISPDVCDRLHEFMTKVDEAGRSNFLEVSFGRSGRENPAVTWVHESAGEEHRALLAFLRARFWDTDAAIDAIFP